MSGTPRTSESFTTTPGSKSTNADSAVPDTTPGGQPGTEMGNIDSHLRRLLTDLKEVTSTSELFLTSKCPSEKAMAPYSSTLAWKTPWTEEPGRLQSVGLLSWTQLSNFTFTFHFHALEKEMATHSSVLAWRIPGTGEPGGLQSMGSHRVRHDWSNLAAAAAAVNAHIHDLVISTFMELMPVIL